jgi:hypothetical protein
MFAMVDPLTREDRAHDSPEWLAPCGRLQTAIRGCAAFPSLRAPCLLPLINLVNRRKQRQRRREKSVRNRHVGYQILCSLCYLLFYATLDAAIGRDECSVVNLPALSALFPPRSSTHVAPAKAPASHVNLAVQSELPVAARRIGGRADRKHAFIRRRRKQCITALSRCQLGRIMRHPVHRR